MTNKVIHSDIIFCSIWLWCKVFATKNNILFFLSLIQPLKFEITCYLHFLVKMMCHSIKNSCYSWLEKSTKVIICFSTNHKVYWFSQFECNYLVLTFINKIGCFICSVFIFYKFVRPILLLALFVLFLFLIWITDQFTKWFQFK